MCVLTLLFFFALRAAGGELRIYQLICFFGGMVLFFTLCSEMLRPLWDFWTDALLRFVRFSLLPFQFLHRLGRKFALFGKKLFHFQKKYYIISRYRKRFPQRRGVYGTREQKTSFRSADSAGTGRAGDSGLAARVSRRSHQRRKGTGKSPQRRGTVSHHGERNAPR
ncbi:MAG: hypothetical protein IKB53_06835 [Oscillospiraceae bacterium]|nr:hypothetical protein [Oscillospiraceae bacterium]